MFIVATTVFGAEQGGIVLWVYQSFLADSQAVTAGAGKKMDEDGELEPKQ